MRFRRILGTALASILVVMLCSTASAASDAARAGQEFEYTNTDEGVEITKYVGRSAAVQVPAEINGHQVRSIGTWAFTSVGTSEKTGEQYSMPRTDIRSIELPPTLTRIAPYAFDSLAALETIRIPDSVIQIGRGAFLHCTALRRVELPRRLASVPEECFRGCALETVTVPENTSSIGPCAFAENYALRSAQLPYGLSSIGDGAFSADVRLTELDIPDSVEQLGIGAFGYTGLRRITIPANVREVPAGLLMWCNALSSVRFNCLPARISQNAFLDCPLLETVEVDATKAEWGQVTVEREGNQDLLNAAMQYLRTNGALEAAAAGIRPEDIPGSIVIRAGSPLYLKETSGGWQMAGYSVGTASQVQRDGELLNTISVPNGVSVRITHTSGGPKRAGSDTLGTGDRIIFELNGRPAMQATLVVRGDVLGTGVMSLSQMVRLQSAITGAKPLEGCYLEAGDVNGSGTVTLSDLVAMAAMLKAA